MEKIINISTFKEDLDRFEQNSKNMELFLRKNKLDGFELLQYNEWKESMIPASMVKGVHMRHYPTWIDFWRGNHEKLINQFKNQDNIYKYYNAKTRDDMVAKYKIDIENAAKTGAKYLVFHVSHVELKHCFNYKFTYTDSEVLDCAIELLNEIFEGYKGGLTLLLENLWWPGLTLKDSKVMEKLMTDIKYPNKGFMMDTAHLMNTNYYLKNENEAVKYILRTIENLGSLKDHIQGIHLNSSLSGSYVIDQLQKNSHKDFSVDFNDFKKIFYHIRNIDQHKPFLDKGISKVIDLIEPKYLVYEFITKSLEEMNDYISQQNNVLNY
ncbi:TIM barrel protein [Tepidibacter hydrothermalis]|uniref:TIM barrel protein n=1 Tax=Tepidibacter hydrothermalis TaxID=3036126 RepID=A0ABY8EEH7_9FIRM|nr:TIM barrel protein [Tepidibacter hydrothermalis]WFD10184.1 TIM barrel protein [Tepidibacter hydrothermalis]